MTKVRDLTGQRFSRLTVQARSPINDSRGKSMWHCLCDCGQATTVCGSALIQGNTKSCGCLKHEASVANGKAKRRHGMTKSKVWICWDSMLQRCNNPKHKSYPQYGGRGIAVCERWHVFENFYEDMGEPNELTLDRIDVNGNYEKSNCRWATLKEQGRNTRANRLLTFQGETKPLSYFTEKFGLRKNLIRERLQRGWTVEDAILQPDAKLKRWLEVDGVKRPFMDVAREYGINPVTLEDRLGRGWSLEDALEKPIEHNQRDVTFNGETMGISAWARKLGVGRKTLARRLAVMAVEDAFANVLQKKAA